MPYTVGVNMMSVIHQQSAGIAMAMPDVCLTPSSNGPIPIPYPCIGMSSNVDETTNKVKCEGNPVCIEGSTISETMGDSAGVNGGVSSGMIEGKTNFMNQSMNVMFEGKGVIRALDLCTNNNNNTPPMPIIQPPVI